MAFDFLVAQRDGTAVTVEGDFAYVREDGLLAINTQTEMSHQSHGVELVAAFPVGDWEGMVREDMLVEDDEHEDVDDSEFEFDGIDEENDGESPADDEVGEETQDDTVVS